MPSDTSTLTQAVPPGLAGDYLPAPGVYDEMRGPDGTTRPHWSHLLGVFQSLGPEGAAQRLREAGRLIRDNGVTFNLLGGGEVSTRPWDLDLIPLLLRSEEWAVIERGLMQRAEVLNHILLDLYGPRKLLRDGLIPIDMIDGFPGYLLPCHGIQVPADRPLVNYAADLTRTAEGCWYVIADRTQNPSGCGYALENRVVLSRVLPSLFRDSHVHRVAGFFRSMRRTLTRLSPSRDGHARVAVLTPGPENEAHFEHAYLANYLGYSLVQGGDLSVRDGALWLRTLGRLEPIHAVFRRVDDDWCDPLELREDSLLGVPGLVESTRKGKVVLANALGSGVLEHPGLAAYLPEICRQVLGEDLLLTTIPTYWCGDPAQLPFVLDNLPALVIRIVNGPRAGKRIMGEDLGSAERAELIEQIRAHPSRYVAKAWIQPSTSPSLIGNRIEPRPTLLRSFLVSEEDGYTVLPGGLGRVSASLELPLVSTQLGGLAKDAWVLATEPELKETPIASADRAQPAVVQESEVSSRVADNLFWIGRYAERAEGLVRLLRVAIFRLQDRIGIWGADDIDVCAGSLLEALTRQTQTLPGFVGEGAEERLADPTPEMLSLICDPERTGTLPQCLSSLENAAWSVRDRLSGDTWRVVSDVSRHLQALVGQPPTELNSALRVLDPLITSLVAFSALTHENMTHNEGWHFLEAGRRLERGSNLGILLRSTMVPVIPEGEENTLIEAVLGVTDSIITYRRRYQAGTRVGALLDLVFTDETNPRSLAYQLVNLEPLVHAMPRMDLSVGRTQAEKLVLKLLTTIRLCEMDRLLTLDETGTERSGLKALLEEVCNDLAAISNALTARYFAHEEQPHTLLSRDRRAGQ